MKIFIIITNFLMALVLSRFAISKLTGWEISVKAFIEMAQPLGIDPTFFRIFTGIIISLIVIGYFTSALYTLFKVKLAGKLKISYSKFVQFSKLAGLLTMVGALFAEFFLRVEPKWLLVYIAIAVILFSSINIYVLKAKK